MSQVSALVADARRGVGRVFWRWPAMIFSPGFAALAWYRFNRAGHLRFGRGWDWARGIASPLVFLIRPWIPYEIDYRASIGPGFAVLHSDLGVVISGTSIVGAGCTFAGGNGLGGPGIVLGDGVELGLNALIIGPVTLGDNVIVGAGAVVTRSQVGPATLVGVPAAPLERTGRERARGEERSAAQGQL